MKIQLGLDGWKTYLVAIAIAIVSVLHGKGIIDELSWQTIMGILVGTGVTTMRHAVAKINPTERPPRD